MSDEDVLAQATEAEDRISEELHAVARQLRRVLSKEEALGSLERRIEALEERMADVMGGLWAVVDWIRDGE